MSERIELYGGCDPHGLSPLTGDGALVICDCEGAELDLLDPAVTPTVLASDHLVETHDLLVPGVTEALRRRFAATHEITEVPSKPRYVADYEGLDFMPVSRQLAISEFRHAPMTWLAMRRRS